MATRPAAALDGLTGGPLVSLSEIPSIVGTPAGVYTVWYRGRLLGYGRSHTAPGEGKATNLRQAAGVTGRLRRLLSQPPAGLQHTLRRQFPSDMADARGATDQQRASALLRAGGYGRWVETSTGSEAQALYDAISDELQRILDQQKES